MVSVHMDLFSRTLCGMVLHINNRFDDRLATLHNMFEIDVRGLGIYVFICEFNLLRIEYTCILPGVYLTFGKWVCSD